MRKMNSNRELCEWTCDFWVVLLDRVCDVCVCVLFAFPIDRRRIIRPYMRR
jgi:hypothetical protein